MSTGTEVERLTRIETLLERMGKDVSEIRIDQIKDKEDLAALKNRGAGILIGVSMIAAFLGAKVGAIATGIASLFK